MNILKTFDLFYRESLSVLKERIINFILFDTNSASSENARIYAQIKKNKEMQISVVNNAKVYNLLTSAWEKQKMKQKNENIKS